MPLPQHVAQVRTYLLPAATSLKSCVVCLEDLTSTNQPKRPTTSTCAHKENLICSPCLQKSMTAQASSKGPGFIRCPAAECNAALAYDDIRAFAAPEAFIRYDTYLSHKAMKETPGYVSCANPGQFKWRLVDPRLDSFFTCFHATQPPASNVRRSTIPVFHTRRIVSSARWRIARRRT